MGVDCGEGCLHSSLGLFDVPLVVLAPFMPSDWSPFVCMLEQRN